MYLNIAMIWFTYKSYADHYYYCTALKALPGLMNLFMTASITASPTTQWTLERSISPFLSALYTSRNISSFMQGTSLGRRHQSSLPYSTSELRLAQYSTTAPYTNTHVTDIQGICIM